MIGEELGSYRVIKPIGTGGMASVFVGEHVVLGHRVAIKVLHQARPDHPMIERRFVNEAKAIAAIRHPGIIEVFDFGRGVDGRAYIVMELLEGQTLRDRMRRGPLPLEQTLVFARQIASAVAVAHDAGIIHRDLKPDNIFIIPDGEIDIGERIKVLDFGVAKNLEESRPVNEMTATGVLVGTPAYMSPEQCRGDARIDHRTDIYSLGIVTYRMVTGQLPFDSPGTGELIGKHIFEQAPSVHELDPRVPVELAELIGKCLAKEPSQRFQSMAEVANRLNEIRGQVFNVRSSTILPVEPMPPRLHEKPAGAIGKHPTIDDVEDTHPTTLRGATGETYSAFPGPSRWSWPLVATGVIGIGVFLALLIAGSGDEVRKSGDMVPVQSRPASGAAADPGDSRPDVTRGRDTPRAGQDDDSAPVFSPPVKPPRPATPATAAPAPQIGGEPLQTEPSVDETASGGGNAEEGADAAPTEGDDTELDDGDQADETEGAEPTDTTTQPRDTAVRRPTRRKPPRKTHNPPAKRETPKKPDRIPVPTLY